MNYSWDMRWMQVAELAATWSKDPDAQIGAIIINPHQDVIGLGWNGYPKGVKDSVTKKFEKPLKFKWMEHAERNAIYDAASQGSSTRGCRMYTTRHPCTDCARAIIQSGIGTVISPRANLTHKRWGLDSVESVQMLFEAGVEHLIYK